MNDYILGGLMAVALSLQGGSALEGKKAVEKHVVFVCEHGSVKSLIAMQLFNQEAAERGLAIRAISRGLTPDPEVPKAIAGHLAEDGLAPLGFKPKAFSKDDLRGAERVIAIGVDLKTMTAGSTVPLESWSDIPPASENYAASRDAIRARVEKMLPKNHK